MCARCLIVDDNRDFLRVATDLLEHGGITVVAVASTGAQAGRACGELHPDLVLIDIDLGEESGLELARHLAGGPGPGQPCVILISAYSAEDFEDMIADTPGVSFLAKGALSGPAVLGILADAGRSPRYRDHRDSR
jgi:two-component system, NarL family, nitrate/nitrite response regulator NarL